MLDEDLPAVRAFNQRLAERCIAPERYRVVEDLLPLPFIGDPAAPVVLLNLNPGFNLNVDYEQQSQPAFQNASRRCYAHAKSATPFFFLDPLVGRGFVKAGGRWWWERVFASFLREGDFDPATVAKAFFCVEYFPYHSREFRPLGAILESQRYGFALVEKAIDRKAIIILMRAEKEWFSVVRGLDRYSRLYKYNSRSSSLSPRNCPLGFPKVLRELQRMA